jgi:hypothetical protein
MEKFYLIANLFGIVGSIFSIAAGVYSWKVNRRQKREQRRLNKKITVTVACGPKNFDLPGEILGAEFSRSELLGCLGMLPRNEKEKGQRFYIDFLSTPKFHQQINDISKSNENRHLIIPCTEKEFNQFDLELIHENQKKL